MEYDDAMNSIERWVKRLIDIIASFLGVVVLSPVLILVWILILCIDGNAIYSQERIGYKGKPFRIYKFRTMNVDAEKNGILRTEEERKGQMTALGRFLCEHHLDELPQLWNVFCGDMALIGHRPERKFYIDQIVEYDKRYEYLYQIRPGVTSYATFYNGYTDTMEKMLRRLEYDLYYLGHRSWKFDIEILLKTFFGIIFGKKF